MHNRIGRPSKITLSLVLASFVLGFMLTVQFRSTAARLPVREQSRQATTGAVLRLEEEQKQLKLRVAELRSQLAAMQRMEAGAGGVPMLVANTDQQKLLAGLLDLHGPGVTVVLDDSTRAMAPTDDANDFIIHDYELRDVVSLLWLAGAEAISVNGERLVNVSSVYCVGSTILVNDTRLSPPYETRAIGDPAALDQALQNPKNLSQLRSRVKSFGIQFRVVQQKDVVIPAYSGTLNIRYARPTVLPVRPDDSRFRQR